MNEILARARTILARLDSPATPKVDAIITRGAGNPSGYRSIPDLYQLRVACVSGEATVLGLADLSGFDLFHDKFMTANLDTDLDHKAHVTMRCLKEYDLVFLHLKGCDIAAHDQAPEAKLRFIEETDRVLNLILEEHPQDLCVISVADHATHSGDGEHHWSPIPIFVSGPGIVPDTVCHYHEAACRQGSLGRVSNKLFSEAIFRYAQGHCEQFLPFPSPSVVH